MILPNEFRHELKYFLHYHDYITLKSRLSTILKRDPNSDNSGNYLVRSLYFDDIYNSGLFDKLSGVRTREKYRVRVYNLSDQTIKLECKQKKNSLVRKEIDFLSRDEVCLLSQGEFSFLKEGSLSSLRLKFYRAIQHKLLRPVVIVDYIREAFITPYVCNGFNQIRINFDKELKSCLSLKDFFGQDIAAKNVFSEPVIIMEIKFGDYFPDYLKQILKVGSAMRYAISKYALCRKCTHFNLWEDS
ncbi:MAG: polyphosphate polymerase domain-containing protein [Deltaproteobacteria bacterium]|nr:polyphosphate polymerase domain-containing protein [Deltaproteobacteria bacterium]